MSVFPFQQLIDQVRDEASDGVAWLTGRTAGLLDDTAAVLSDVSDTAALTAARVSGQAGEAAGRYASQACGWLADQVSDFGERVTGRMAD
jgi:predicted DNA repair protein MutK